VFIIVLVYFVIDSVRRLLDTPSYLWTGFLREKIRVRQIMHWWFETTWPIFMAIVRGGVGLAFGTHPGTTLNQTRVFQQIGYNNEDQLRVQ